METFKRLKIFYWPYRKVFMWSLLAMLLMTAITVVYPIILQITIDEIVLGRQYQLAAWVSLGFIAVMALKGTATFFHQYLGDMFGIKSVYRLRNGLYEKLQRLSFSYYDNAKTGDLMSRLTADVEGLRFFLSYGLAELIRFVLLVAISLSVMFYYSVPLTLVTIAVLPFLAVAVYQFDKRVHPAFRGIRKSFATLNTKVQENISGINTVKSLSREDFQISTFNKANAEYRAQYLQTSSIWSAYFPLMEFIGNVSIVALLSYGGYLVMQNQLNPGELVAFFSLVNYMMWPIMNLGFVINMFSQAKASGERLLEILEKEEDITDHAHVLHKQKLTGNVHFENVSLAYGKEQTNALRNVSFEANSGKVIGLLGPTGSGKSSVTQLLTRFYSPVGGMITIDHKPLTDYSLKTLRSNIGVVLQESFLFSSTIRANISYGRPDASMEDIIEAAKRAQAHDFIMELPDGYDTMLGERGMGLSGGQKQRIAIARAICLNPSILILDDATSAVDMQTEHSIQLALKEVMKNRTTFIIAHRISSLKHADEILVFDKGRICERGTHQELLEKGGYYKKIYDLQYRDVKLINEPHQVG
ncbi:ABC transporter ATP-binding protein/permease [Bacillus inaquosorum]|uniref:ABC transporter ATP-binding protein/permease n=1 Tax=Bacillus inaquosorum TaxID=483913 RepID=A0A9Q4EXV3_9BACI|nr:ABC transporter ATP-binding protein [Bacillus inaquosorum]MCY7788466.1 ABC transporter ATP-binding protein/permease [Bacillus inaquosorum]MCY7818500.1 ABC transporter ATP-binding protein/permease [Bacillus inaquosorum]MCY7937997.1 ABC transporter ATP-binding protein/permease [Bacillus inaquosorum]MCY7940823.1 ABC transporter ATP-binding protein/permease [Bacillus inaquosorum]MCY7950962.1 ABC transporter ATP-binding protein/permease [Bacillus inaquosorum]